MSDTEPLWEAVTELQSLYEALLDQLIILERRLDKLEKQGE